MLVYEKKVDGERHLFGKVVGTVPSEDDVQLTYKDTDGTTITPELSDTYLNDGHGGIIRKSDGEAINVFIGETQIIGGDIPTPQMESITVTPPTKTAYVDGDALDLTGMTVAGNLSNGETIDITADCTTTPVNGAILTTDPTGEIEVVVSYFELTDTFTVTVEAASEPVVVITGVEVTTEPTKTVYAVGEQLDLTGMVVTLSGTVDGEPMTETAAYNEYVATPAEGTVLTAEDTEVVISAYDLEDSFTITVS